MALGVTILIADLLIASYNFYLGSDGSYTNIKALKQDQPGIWALIFIPYYTITEFVPAIGFAFVQARYARLF